MIRIEADTARNILRVTFSRHVDKEQIQECRTELASALSALKPGIRILTDISHLEEMDFSCAPVVQEYMNACRQKGVSQIVRVIPDPRKDIGLNLMSAFHYGLDVPITTFKTLAEAESKLIY